MEINLVAEGAKFMVFGMSVVFMFLVLLVGVLNIQGKVLTKYFPPKPKPVPVTGGPKPARLEGERLKKVVAAAIMEYKKEKKAK